MPAGGAVGGYLSIANYLPVAGVAEESGLGVNAEDGQAGVQGSLQLGKELGRVAVFVVGEDGDAGGEGQGVNPLASRGAAQHCAHCHCAGAGAGEDGALAQGVNDGGQEAGVAEGLEEVVGAAAGEVDEVGGGDALDQVGVVGLGLVQDEEGFGVGAEAVEVGDAVVGGFLGAGVSGGGGQDDDAGALAAGGLEEGGVHFLAVGAEFVAADEGDGGGHWGGLRGGGVWWVSEGVL